MKKVLLKYVPVLLGILVLLGLYLTSLYNYLLFHSLAEVFSVVIAASMFALAWNARGLLDNDYLLFIGIAYLFVGGVDLVHTIAYKGMGVFPATREANWATQLWIAARYVQSVSLLIAPLYLRRKLDPYLAFLGYSVITALLLAAIFYGGIFPDCYREGTGLTPFKKISEYAISLILCASAALLLQKRGAFDRGVLNLLVWSTLLTIGAELAFTFYVSVYGFSNLVGHYFKILAFYLIYKAIIEKGLTQPQALLFRNLQQARQAAEQASQAKSTFLAKMSHELRTPLNGILGYAQILKRDPSVTPRQRHGLDVIEQSGNHLLALINDILDLAKVEAGRIELHETDFHLPAFLKGIGEVIRFRTKHKGLDFYLELCAELPTSVHGDERRLRQVLINLLDNAIKFTDEGGVAFKVERLEPDSDGQSPLSKLRFTIQDTGVGISPQDLHVIFDPFRQVGDQGRRAKGTGLGLTISRNLVELMGGDLRVESPPTSSSLLGEPALSLSKGIEGGPGSAFWFDLSLPTADYEVKGTAKAQGRIVGVKGKPPQVLVVDDNQENRAVLTHFLSPLGFQVVGASNGQEGLTQAMKRRPDVVIADLLMPKMDGFELVRQMRQSPALKGVAVVATSASVYEKDRQKSLSIGSDAFLPKPIDFDQLLDQLQSLLALEWLYQEPVAENEVAGPTDLILPPVETLEALLNLTRIGDVAQLDAQLAALAQSDERFKPFAARLRQLTQEFRLNRIRDLLEGYLEA